LSKVIIIGKYISLIEINKVCVGWQKVALLVLPKGRPCVSGQNQMCHLCGWLKLFLKKCGGKKNKKLRVCLSVGLLVVQFLYGLYVFGHLSKWFVFVLMFKFGLVSCLWNGRPTIGYNGLRVGDVALCCACGKAILLTRC
jgi:hypothetical protein